MKLLNKIFVIPAAICLLLLISIKSFGQTAPNISYSPNSASLTVGVAMTNMVPSNTGGSVAAFGYGTGITISGGSLDHPYGVVTDASGNVYIANYGGPGKSDPGSV